MIKSLALGWTMIGAASIAYATDVGFVGGVELKSGDVIINQGITVDSAHQGYGIEFGDTTFQYTNAEKGATGATGSLGTSGIAGNTGAKGNTGGKGSQGMTGMQGEVGDTGSVGDMGIKIGWDIQKTTVVDMKQGDSKEISADAVISIEEDISANDVEKSIMASQMAEYEQEDTRGIITQFQVDTAQTNGHFEDVNSTP